MLTSNLQQLVMAASQCINRQDKHHDHAHLIVLASQRFTTQKYAVFTMHLQLVVLPSWQRTTPRPAAHVARPVANCNDRVRMLQYLTIDMAALAVRKWDANDLVRKRLLAILKTILHQQAAIFVEVSRVYVINSNNYNIPHFITNVEI